MPKLRVLCGRGFWHRGGKAKGIFSVRAGRQRPRQYILTRPVGMRTACDFTYLLSMFQINVCVKQSSLSFTSETRPICFFSCRHMCISADTDTRTHCTIRGFLPWLLIREHPVIMVKSGLEQPMANPKCGSNLAFQNPFTHSKKTKSVLLLR